MIENFHIVLTEANRSEETLDILSSTFVENMHLYTLTNMYIQRDVDRFHRIATGFKYGYADVDTISEWSNSTDNFIDVRLEDTSVVHFEHLNNSVQFVFMRPKKEKSIKV